jgi:hypothetical protein
MRSRSGRQTSSIAAAILSGLMAFGSTGVAFAQGSGSKPAQPAAKPAAAGAAGAGETQLSEKEKRAAAKKIFKDAETKYESGDCAGALPLYRQADATLPKPVAKYKIALCLDKVGQTIDAVAAWQAFLDAKPDDKLKDKIPEAQKRIEELKKTPAKVRLVTAPESASNLMIVVDNVQQPSNELSLTPGQHKVTVGADGFAPATQELSVSYAEVRDVSVQLTKAAPPPAPPAAPTEPSKPAAPSPAPRTPSSPVPGYVALGLAGAGAIVGTVFGVLSLGAKQDFEDDPTPEKADDVDSITQVADIAFASALGLGVAGTILLLNSRDPEPPKASARATTKRVLVAPYAGPTGGGAAARFTF